jgi:phosphatidylserine/phosphatidylglycerophosphate/cardiolipin synthase-like enzyme|tara:strand:+ start:5162 stop:5302 length:141 start_codon:yes stop_codon:yes gene_type:complete
LLTGSYNWTKSAADRNQENILVTEDPKMVKSYLSEFEKLWDLFKDF